MEYSAKEENSSDIQKIYFEDKEYTYGGVLIATSLGAIHLLSREGEEFAMKMSEMKPPRYFENPRTEIELLNKFDHKNIIKLVQYDDKSSIIKSVFPRYKTDLFEFFCTLKLEEKERIQVAKKIFFKIGQAIKYMHDRHTYHGDISLENMFINDEDDVVLADFGMAGTLYPLNGFIEKSIGKPCYVSKECIKGYHNPYKTDVWCFGMSIFMAMFNHRIYDNPHDVNHDVVIRRGFSKYADILRKNGSSTGIMDDTTKHFFSKILVTEDRRPSIDAILEDPFFSS